MLPDGGFDADCPEHAARSAGSPAPLAAHRVLRALDLRDYVVDLFNRTAQHYDTIESLFLKGGLWYRRFGMKRAGMKPGMKVLDMATGTGAVARGAARIVGSYRPRVRLRSVAGHARAGEEGVLRSARARRRRLAAVQERAVRLRDDGHRAAPRVEPRAHVREYLRVLKPGGRVWILEGHVPKSRLGHSLTRFVWAKLIRA